MHPTLFLWPGEAPYSAESPGQPQPSLKAFPSESRRSAVIVCPGGGYVHLSAHEGDPVAEMFNAAGLSAFVLNYRLSPCHYLAPLEDILRAVRVVRSMGYEKIAVIGFSAGGHLVSSAATLFTPGNPDADDPVERLSSRPDAFIPCYARVSLSHYPGVHSRMNRLGSLADDVRTFRLLSAEEHVRTDTPPAFIWHTASDSVVPVENSLLLSSALAAKGVPFELHIFPEGKHGLGLAQNDPVLSQWAGLCVRWLKNLGFSE